MWRVQLGAGMMECKGTTQCVYCQTKRNLSEDPQCPVGLWRRGEGAAERDEIVERKRMAEHPSMLLTLSSFHICPAMLSYIQLIETKEHQQWVFPIKVAGYGKHRQKHLDYSYKRCSKWNLEALTPPPLPPRQQHSTWIRAQHDYLLCFRQGLER